MPRDFAQPVRIANSYLELTNPSGSVPGVAPSGKTRLYYDPTANALQVSSNGGAFGSVASAGAAGDSLTLGGDVTLFRVSANKLGITESVLVTSPSAAAVPMGVVAHASQSGNLLSVANSALADQVVIDANFRLGIGRVTSLTYALELLSAADSNTSGSIRVVNSSNTANAAALLQFGSATGSGSIGHYPLGHTAQSTAFQDRLVIRADSDSTGLMLAALSGSQVIELRVATTGTIISVATGTITIADGANFVFNTTTGTSLGAAANQKTGMHGARVVQVAGTVQTFATADATHAARTAAALTMADGAGTNDGTIGAITADASVIAAFQEVVDQLNKLRTDHLNTASFANHTMDGLQLKGIFA